MKGLIINTKKLVKGMPTAVVVSILFHGIQFPDLASSGSGRGVDAVAKWYV